MIPRLSMVVAMLVLTNTAPAATPEWSLQRLRERFYAPIGELSMPSADDRVEDLVDEVRYRSAKEMSALALESGKVETSPWTDNYWPYYAGVIGIRYLDAGFPPDDEKKDFLVYEQYLTRTMGQLDPKIYSPSEKYDLLVGDTDFTLTKTMLSWGRSIYDRMGKVESWMGLCFGWSGASMMVPRPVHSVTLLAADGKTQIEFLPSDIKALATLLWNAERFPRRTLGYRCHKKKPEGSEPGRPSDPACLDTNPGTWHVAVVNQIHIGKRSLVMDADSAYEVWNQPVLSYRYTYFNPKTGTPAASFDAAQVPLRDFPNDKYARFRSDLAHSVVGIDMEVTYLYTDYASNSKTDSPSKDKTKTTHFRYDLELDRNGMIIGGEWYDSNHPDFLWIPTKNARASSLGDGSLPGYRWRPGAPLPEAWSRTARWTSSYGEPLAAIVEHLVEQASR